MVLVVTPVDSASWRIVAPREPSISRRMVHWRMTSALRGILSCGCGRSRGAVRGREPRPGAPRLVRS